MRFEDAKMKTFTNKYIKVISGVMTAVLLLGGCAGKTPSGKPLTDDPSIKAEIDLGEVKKAEYDSALMDSEYKRYTFALLSQTIKDFGGDENVMVSPASVMIALDMAAAGAKKDSLRQLTDLFAEGQDPLLQQAYAAALMDKINNSKDVKFACANAVWNNSRLLGDKVNTRYVDYIHETFLAEYRVTEFNKKTCDEINGWICDHTDKKIENMLDELDPGTVMVLVNAITFDAKWDEPYEKDNVQDGEFTASDGHTQKATFLSDTSYNYFETDKATGFLKNYKGGEYAFLAILPKDTSVSANEFAKSFTSADYEAFINSRTGEYRVHSRMPEFKSDFKLLMNDTVKNLGAKDIFEPGLADFSGIAGAPGDIYVSKVLHQTHIEVDAQGTKASAATVVSMTKNAAVEETSNDRYVNCDRPYVYAIVDTGTMAPVFIGTVNGV